MKAAHPHTSGGTELAEFLILAWRDTHHPDAGGSEVYVQRVADGLAARGHRVTIATALYEGADPETMLASGVRIVRAGGRFGVYRQAMRAYRHGRLGRPDVILEVQNGVPYLSRLWARDTRHVILVHHVHKAQWQMIFGPIRARIGWWLESKVAPRLNRGLRYLTISEASKRELAGIGIRSADITVAYSGTDPAARVEADRTEQPSLVVLGRLVPHKQIELAIEATARLRHEFPSIELVIAGEGWWHENLSRHAAAEGVSDHVRFTGFLPEEDKQRLLATSWLMLMPSRKEGWGLVVSEAGLQETPAVAFRDGGGVTESIVHGQTGILVEGTDVESLTREARRLMHDESRRRTMGAAARSHALMFTWDHTVNTVEETLLRAINPARPQSGQRVP